MTRRRFLLPLAAHPVAHAAVRSPRNDVAIRANEFIAQWREWANAWNEMEPGSLDLAEDNAFQPLKGLFRRVESARTAWMRGYVR